MEDWSPPCKEAVESVDAWMAVDLCGERYSFLCKRVMEQKANSTTVQL